MKIVLRILFNFLLILKVFEMSVNGNALPNSVSDFNCVEYAQKIGANWKTLNCVLNNFICEKFQAFKLFSISSATFNRL